MIILKTIRPLFTTVITTMDMVEEKDTLIKGTSLIDTSKMKKSIKEYQKVIAVGPHVNNIKVGDIVCVNPTRFMTPVQKKKANSVQANTEEYSVEVKYQFDIIELNGSPFLKLQDRDIDYVVEEYEEFDENPIIVTEDNLKKPVYN